MFVVLSGSQANALSFGKAVIIANTDEGTLIDDRLQKVFSIAIIGIVCLLQAYSRINYVRFNNLFALYKILLLTFLTITGWCAIAGKRAASAEAVGKPYGIENLRSKDFVQANSQTYGYALALLSIMRVFLGYENANFVSLTSQLYAHYLINNI
jgi:amino acid transporter